MLLQATEIQYDYANKRVFGGRQRADLSFGATLEADRVIYDEKTKRLHAEGNVRLTEPDGNVTYGEIMNLSDDFRDGFVDSLRLETPRPDPHGGRRAPTAPAAISPCSRAASTPPARPARKIRSKPPLWQVAGRPDHPRPRRADDLFRERASRILRPADRLFPVLLGARSDRQAQDRLADAGGVLHQQITGFGIEVPYYWALAPDYDFTFSPQADDPPGRRCCRPNTASGWPTAPISIRGVGHLPARQGCLQARLRPAARPATATGAAASKPPASSRSTTDGSGASTACCCRTGPFLRLRPAPAPSALRPVPPRPDRGRLAALSRRPRRPQLFRRARASTISGFARPTTRTSFRSSIRSSTTITSSPIPFSAASSATTSTSPA